MCCSVPLHLEFTRFGHYRLELDGVDQWLSQSNILDGRVIKPINIIPDYARKASTPSGRENPPRVTANEHAQLIFSSL